MNRTLTITRIERGSMISNGHSRSWIDITATGAGCMLTFREPTEKAYHYHVGGEVGIDVAT